MRIYASTIYASNIYIGILQASKFRKSEILVVMPVIVELRETREKK